jgi:hypothetical protein
MSNGVTIGWDTTAPLIEKTLNPREAGLFTAEQRDALMCAFALVYGAARCDAQLSLVESVGEFAETL